MKKIFRFIIVTILSTLIFGIVFLNSVNISIEPILGLLYDYARPDLKENLNQNFKQTCETLPVIKNNPNALDDLSMDIKIEELESICAKNLEDKQLFIEIFKLQTGDVEDMINKNPETAKYSGFLEKNSKNLIISIGLIIFFMFLLFLVENNPSDFLKSIGKILLTTSLSLIAIYMLPKAMLYFFKPDTSFLLEVGSQSTKSRIFSIFPIILDEILDEKMLVYGGVMLLISVAILLVLRIRNKSTK